MPPPKPRIENANFDDVIYIITPNGVICQHLLVFFCIIISHTICEVRNMFVYPRVRDLREDSDKTQKQIAELLNMQLTVYQRYERGERELPLWAAIKLADYYNITLDYLVGRNDK